MKIMFNELKFLLCGDTAITIEIGNDINENINKKVMMLYDYLKKNKFKGVKDIVPTYRSITIFYNPIEFKLKDLKQNIKMNFQNIENDKCFKRKVIEIPVIYGGKYGIDLDKVAKHNNLTQEEVIRMHCSNTYLIYMIGFTPGFPYLGGLNEKIATPRLKIPRKKVKKGSVGIAGSQTGIYPLDSSGGWNIIGQTPISLFRLDSQNTVIFKPGEYIKFIPISEETYKELKIKEEGKKSGEN